MQKLKKANTPSYKFGLAILITLVALLMSWITTTLSVLMAGMILSAWLGGLSAGILSVVITIVGINIVGFTSYSDLIQLAVFSSIALLIAYVEDQNQNPQQITHDGFKVEVASKQLVAIVQNSDDAIIGKSLEGIIQSWNPGAEQLYGYTAQEAIGQHISLLFPEDIKTREIRLIERVLSGEHIHHYETKRISKSGHLIDISLTISPIRDMYGRLIGYSTIERNITYRKRREAEIFRLRTESRERHQRLQTIVANIPGIVYTGSGVDGLEHRKMDFISEYAETMLGYSVDECLSAPNLWKQVIHPDDWHEVVAQADQIDRSGEPGSVQFRCITKDDQTLYVEAHTSVLHDEHGAPIGTCGVVMDISERKNTQDQLVQVTKLLEALNQRFVNLVDNVPGIVYERTLNTANGSVQYNYISDYTEKMLGYPAETWKSNSEFWHEIVPTEDIQAGLIDIVNTEDERTSGSSQFRSYDRRGRMHTLETYYHAVQQDDTIKSYGVIMDISDRKRLETAELEQRKFAEALADISALLTSSLNLSDVFQRILFSLHRVVPHDYASITIIDQDEIQVIQYPNANPLAHDQHQQGHIDDEWLVEKISQTGEAIIIDNLQESLDSQDKPAFNAYLGVPIQLRQQVLGYIHLLSETLNFFEAVHMERLTAFSRLATIAIQNARLFDESQRLATLEERQRLARELHDSVSQTLFTCRTMSESAIRRWEKSPGRAYELMKDVNQLTATALAQMRILLLELRPASLKHVNLKQLFEQYLRPIQERREFELSMAIDEMPPLPPDVKIALYRITQEALNNIDKHAQASHVAVKGTHDAEQITIEISDDGRGFLLDDVKTTSLGLNIMRERAENIGALLEINSEPQKGTQISVLWRKENR